MRLYVDSHTSEDPDGGIAWNTISIYELEVYGGNPDEKMSMSDVLNGIMHLDYENIRITSFPKKWGSEAEVYYTLSEDEYADRVYFFLDEPISKAYISSLEQNYYLISKNAVAIKEETGKTVEQLVQEVGNARKNFLSALGKMKILRLVYLILRMIVLLQCIRWSGQRRKRKEKEILQNR